MLQGLVNSLEEEEQLAMEEALTSSPIASHLLDFSADDADLFAEALISTSTDDVSSSHPAAIATTCSAAMDPSIHSCSYDDTSFVSAALTMDPATLSSLLDVKMSDPDPEEFIQTISSDSNGYPEATLPVIQQDQFDQIATDGFSTALYPVSAMLQPPAYEEECLIPAGLTCYVGIEPTVAANSCSFVDPGNDGMMYHGGMNFNAVCGGGGGVEGQGGFFPTMVGSIEPGMGLQEMAEYQNRPSAVAMGVYYGMEPLQHAYNTSPPELQVFGDRQQQVCTSSSPASVADLPSLDDSTFKVGRISAEERKEKIHRYMKKRNERNFSKKIKYACRKTLADSRPRVRGRFAKNEDSGETTRPRSSHNEYDDDEELQVVVKEEDLFDPSDILAHISGVNSFKYNYTVESWI